MNPHRRPAKRLSSTLNLSLRVQTVSLLFVFFVCRSSCQDDVAANTMRRQGRLWELRLWRGEDLMEIKAFIDTLNPEQQQVAFDLLWQRLAADSRSLDSPAWHEDVLAYRTANPSSEPTMPVAEARIAVKRIINERRNSQ